MTTVTDCLAMFAAAALIGGPDARDQARAAIDRYLEPYKTSPLGATAALYELLDAFDEMKIESTGAREIRSDVEGRLQGIAAAIITGNQLPPGFEGPQAS